MSRDEVVEHPVELGPVGDLRHRVFRDLSVQCLAFLFERSFRGNVVQENSGAWTAPSLLRTGIAWRSMRRAGPDVP